MTSSDFAAFKINEPARATCRAVGILSCLDAARDWAAFRALVVKHNDCDIGRVVEAARRYDAVCSSGEHVLLNAVLYVCDFAWLADELDTDDGEGKAWRRISNASGEFREAVLACIGADI